MSIQKNKKKFQRQKKYFFTENEVHFEFKFRKSSHQTISMLLFYCLSLCSASYIKVTGFIPSIFTSQFSTIKSRVLNQQEKYDLLLLNQSNSKNPSAIEIEIIESTNITKSHIERQKVCSFSEPIPPFSIFKKRGKTFPLISIAPNVEGRLTIANALFSRRFSASLSNQIISDFQNFKNNENHIQNNSNKNLNETNLNEYFEEMNSTYLIINKNNHFESDYYIEVLQFFNE
ncbi:hypothetical protein TRFO_31780 [Tritrichomonas foetus]|uniref:Uncharacterized protein n=1 Tax=Tritrichomonas foetus TaxID=1144522 RepID=A0A1J4JV49_9EUKA|nr:hypothetical protein TRFO_31780 [Tritrichomonas foetus]|eukprot:OHT01406.1 hypothetical protein TRFO_31780 [Tritrichomonas foetus]